MNNEVANNQAHHLSETPLFIISVHPVCSRYPRLELLKFERCLRRNSS